MPHLSMDGNLSSIEIQWWNNNLIVNNIKYGDANLDQEIGCYEELLQSSQRKTSTEKSHWYKDQRESVSLRMLFELKWHTIPTHTPIYRRHKPTYNCTYVLPSIQNFIENKTDEKVIFRKQTYRAEIKEKKIIGHVIDARSKTYFLHFFPVAFTESPPPRS